MHEEKLGPSKTMTQKVGLFLGPVLFLVVLLFFDLDPGKPIVTRMAAVAILMAAWWITDAIPLFATALLPMVLFPLLGIMKGRAAAPIYFNSTIFLLLGGFMIALTMEKWNLHKRIALFIIRVIGGGPFFRVPKHVTVDRSIVDKEYKELGSMSFEERSVLIVFFLTAFLWVFRKK